MKRVPFLLLALAAVACSNAPIEEASDSSEGAASAQARAKLDAYTGNWTVEKDDSDVKVFPEKVLITVVDDEVDPTTKETKGTRVRIMDADAPTVPAVDRAPFINVDEGKSCENVSFGGGESATVCHETTLSNGGHTLTHTVKVTSYAAFVFPTGWSTATQVLSLSGEKLHYTYTIDGKPSSDVILAR